MEDGHSAQLHDRRKLQKAPRLPSPETHSRPLSDEADHYVTKDELRAELERQEKRFKDVYGGEVTTYAAQPDPERKPWRKRSNYLDQAFEREIQKIEKELGQNS